MASTTGNIYGIYDLSGGLYEWTAGYIVATGNYELNAGSLKGESTKYKSKYAGSSSDKKENFEISTTRVGEAIWEIATLSTESSTWNLDITSFVWNGGPFCIRGGTNTMTTKAGIFGFSQYAGVCYWSTTFRPILIVD